MATNEELVIAIKAGERERLPELWNQVERFARMIARRRVALVGEFGGATFEDLCQSGYIALAEATGTWSPDPGVKFLTWYEFYLKSAFAEAGGYQSGKPAHDPLHRAGSLDVPAGEDENGASLADLIPDPSNPIAEVEDQIYNEQLHEVLETALQQLPADEEAVIRAIYYDGRALKEVGKQTRIIQRRALEHLRRLRISRELRQFAGQRSSRHGLGQDCAADHTSADNLAAMLRDRMRTQAAYAQKQGEAV